MATPRGHRTGFLLRLMLALAAALGAVGAAQYTAVGHTLTSTAVDDLKAAHTADATVLRDLHDAEDGGMAAVTELLGHIASRPGVERVVLRDAAGNEALVGLPTAHGASTRDDAGTGSVDDGVSRPMPEEQGAVEAAGLITVSVPVDLAGQAFTMEVQRDDSELRASVGALRRVVLATLAGGLLLVLPLFYVVGGRSLVSSHREAVEGSTTDGLTGLGNHRCFHDDLRRAVSTAHRHDRDLTLVLVDLDGFKQVNDTHGHARGDRVLVAVGSVLRDGRDGDRAYRIGGDEFALLLPETDVAGGLTIAERIRGRVEREVEGVSTSIGVASLGVAWPDGASLLNAADAALYVAKGEGRNRVVPAHPVTEATAAHV